MGLRSVSSLSSDFHSWWLLGVIPMDVVRHRVVCSRCRVDIDLEAGMECTGAVRAHAGAEIDVGTFAFI